MENIRPAEEEMNPLASPRRRVAEAYATSDTSNNMKKIAFWVFAFAFLLVLSAGNDSGGSKKEKRAKALRSKAETMPESEVQKLQKINKKIELDEKLAKLNDAHAAFEDSEDASLNDGVMEDEDDIDWEVSRVFDDVEMAEEDEIDSNNSMLTSAVQTVEESVKYYLGRVFGYGEDGEYDDDDDDDDFSTSGASADVKLTEEQLDMIAKKISDRLARDVKEEFRARADSVKEEKRDEIDRIVAEDKGARMNASEIKKDIQESEAVVVEDLKDEIDDAAIRVKDKIPEKVKKIRDDVVEEVTGKKLDDIERKKRARKERKQELVKKFHEMRAKADEEQERMKQNRGDSGGPKPGGKVSSDGESKKKVNVQKGEDAQVSRGKPKEKINIQKAIEIVRSEAKQEGKTKSQSSGNKKPRRPQSHSEDKKAPVNKDTKDGHVGSNDSKTNRGGRQSSENRGEDGGNKSGSLEVVGSHHVSENSKDEDEVAMSSGRREKSTQEED